MTLMNVERFADHLLAVMDRPSMLPVVPGMPLGEHFAAIRRNYIEMAQRVCEGLETWERSDPRLVADWDPLFSPIERIVWEEIRNRALPLWPQYPAGRFFLDFASPTARVAIECDGLEFHDPIKDAQRDAELGRLGWTVYRVPGWRCVRDMDSPAGDASDEEWAQYRFRRHHETVHGILDLVTVHHFPGLRITVGGMA